ncbi:MAG: hypothetical protein WD269_05920 [Acidimicrobiia bacterium]
MARLTDRFFRMALGSTDFGREGRRRTLRGLRESDHRQLYLGLALTGLNYLRRTRPRKQLLYRKSLPKGTALVIHHQRSGEPRLQIIKPKRRG